MMRIIAIFLTIVVLSACSKNVQPRQINAITIKKYQKDSTSIRAIYAVNAQTVYYAGAIGDVGYTKNNGKTWHTKRLIYKDTLVPNFRALAYNGTAFFALSIANPALLYKITGSTTKLVYTETHPKVFYDALTFFDDNKHGIAVGDPTENCASILLTDNAGKSWQKLPCNNLPEIAKDEAFFAASNTNIKTIGSTVWIVSGGSKARVLKSNNYGKTWQVYSTPIIQGNGPQGIYSVDFLDKNNGIIIGGNYAKPLENIANKAVTKDGGKTWQLVANGKNPAYKSCIKYVPNTNGKEVFAVGKTGVSFSNNGGFTWQNVSKDSYYTIMFVDKHTAWLGGQNKIGKLEFN